MTSQTRFLLCQFFIARTEKCNKDNDDNDVVNLPFIHF